MIIIYRAATVYAIFGINLCQWLIIPKSLWSCVIDVTGNSFMTVTRSSEGEIPYWSTSKLKMLNAFWRIDTKILIPWLLRLVNISLKRVLWDSTEWQIINVNDQESRFRSTWFMNLCSNYNAEWYAQKFKQLKRGAITTVLYISLLQ